VNRAGAGGAQKVKTDVCCEVLFIWRRKVIKEKEDKLKKCEKSLKDKPKHKFAPQWTAQITGLTLELKYLNELKVDSKNKIMGSTE
jgi:hypothetical protein